MSFPGEINPTITTIDKDHPLILVDPSLNTVLATLPSRIQQHYIKAKHLPLGGSVSDTLEFQPISFTTQEAEGLIYYVKLLVVHHGSKPANQQEDEYIHVKVYSEPWTQTVDLRAIAVNKRVADSLLDPMPPILDEIPEATVH